MFRDIFLYFAVALSSLAVLIELMALLGLGVNRHVVLTLILYFAFGAYVVFHICRSPSQHPLGKGNLISVARNIWWAAWWPWFLWRRWRR